MSVMPDINETNGTAHAEGPSRAYWLTIKVLLLIPAILGAWSASIWTPTHDEYWHLPLGLYALRTWDARPDPINPPLVRMWAALPLWLSGVSSGEVTFPAKDAYGVGDAFQRAHPGDHREQFFTGRLMMLPFGVLGGAIIVWWTRHWWGSAAGLLAAALWCGCPILLAHAALVAHDFPATVAILAVLVAAVKDRERPHALGPWLIGGLIGLACLIKFSALMLLAITPLFWWILPGPNTVTFRQAVLAFLKMLFAWWVVLHAGYLADSLYGQPLPSLPWYLAWLPHGFVQGVEALRATLKVPHPVYLDGEWSLTGFRTYYVLALLYQLPLGLWGSFSLAVFLAWKDRGDAIERRRLIALAVVMFAVLIPASLSGNQLGLRYVMPIVPLLILMAARAARQWANAGSPRRIPVLLMAGLTLASLRYHPHHLSYFNELAGGPERGSEHLVDSNLDWGQDLHALRDYLRQHPSDEPLHLAYFGTASPAMLGIDYQFPPAPQPQPGRYAISANFVAGRPHMLRDLDGRERVLALDEFAPFRFFTPKARMGYSIFYYELSPEDVARYHSERMKILREFSGG